MTVTVVSVRETHDKENRFTYTPCESDTDCEGNAAVRDNLLGNDKAFVVS